jgi:Raf kinase inhibitor-like YbhB/YbcL family protein
VLPAVVTVALVVASSAFHAGARIPARYTCDGKNLSPALRWTHVPRGTHSFAIRLDDPDAPGGTFTHWTVWNIPASTTAVSAAYRSRTEGRNTFGRIRYSGPCPPPGAAHHYVFRLYALNRMLALQRGASPEQFASALRGHVLATARLVGTYAR